MQGMEEGERRKILDISLVYSQRERNCKFTEIMKEMSPHSVLLLWDIKSHKFVVLSAVVKLAVAIKFAFRSLVKTLKTRNK